MSTNVSKEKRNILIKKIEDIKTFIQSSPQDDNTAQLLTYISDIEKDIKGKKYGLVFEEHREGIDEVLENNLPVLTEDADLFIDNGGQMNFLIEGDNLASLKLLEKTHKGKIDLIYIDPPYNTGRKDFVYDDVFVDANDSFRHSKWLSFMEQRLKIAKDLLSDKGVIFVSIDDNEFSQLKLLLDQLLGYENFVASLVWETKREAKGIPPIKMCVTNQEYVLVYSKNNQFKFLGEKRNVDDGFKNPDNDPRGPWKRQYLQRFGQGFSVRTIVNPENNMVFSFESPYTEEKMNKWIEEGVIIFPTSPDKYPARKEYFYEYDNPFKPITTSLGLYSTKVNSEKLKELFDQKKVFDYSKPTQLIADIINKAAPNDITILDFFAGSGTTGHAVMKLNAEDGGSRKFILCTNNENNICRDVTYERIKRVIAKEDYKASLKYFKVDFLPISDKLYYEYADELLAHIRELVELENGINFNGNNEIAIVLTEAELDEFVANIPETCKAIYVGHDVLPTEEQEKIFAMKKIKVNVIPEYYYRDLEG